MGLVALLQSKKPRSAGQIAAHFGISERTAFRDLRALGEVGVPVVFDDEKGYSVGPGFFLPPVSLTLEEASALSLAAPLVERFGDRSAQRLFASALDKIKGALSRSQREKMEAAEARTAHFVPERYAHWMPATEFLAPLQTAIAAQKIVRIEYENASGEPSEREVEPIGLAFYALNWHLIAWCWRRLGYRDFRVSRIQKLRATLQDFRKTDHRSLADYLVELEKEISARPETP